jgi:ketosteroid isomerase-like protein
LENALGPSVGFTRAALNYLAARRGPLHPRHVRVGVPLSPSKAPKEFPMHTEANDMVAAIERVMVAVAQNDRARLDELLCDDFHAFENGVHMSGSELLDLMGSYYAKGKRYRWSVTSPQIESQGDFGAVVYLNVGSIIEAPGTEPIAMSWLETALLRRQDARWRLAFLHSTRAKATQSAAEPLVRFVR